MSDKPSKNNIIGVEEKIGVVTARDSGNPRQATDGTEKLVGDNESIRQLNGEEIFWIPFQPNSNEAEERLFDVETDLREVEKVQGGTFEKAEQLDPAKDSHQEENLVGHDTNTKTLENEESFAEREIKFAKLNSSSAHAQISSLLVKSIIFMQSLLYFYS